MGDQQDSKAHGDQRTDGDHLHGAFTTGGRQLNALAVVDGGAGQLINILDMDTVISLDIGTITIGISEDIEGLGAFTCSDGNGGGQGVIAVGCLDFLQVVGAFFQTENDQLTVELRNHQVVLLGCVIRAKISFQMFFVLNSGGQLIFAFDIVNVSAQAVEHIDTFDIGGNNIDGLGASFIAVEAELGACQIHTGGAVVLQNTDTVNFGFGLIGGAGAGFVLTGPGSRCAVDQVGTGAAANCSVGLNGSVVSNFNGGRRGTLGSIIVLILNILSPPSNAELSAGIPYISARQHKESGNVLLPRKGISTRAVNDQHHAKPPLIIGNQLCTSEAKIFSRFIVSLRAQYMFLRYQNSLPSHKCFRCCQKDLHNNISPEV